MSCRKISREALGSWVIRDRKFTAIKGWSCRINGNHCFALREMSHSFWLSKSPIIDSNWNRTSLDILIISSNGVTYPLCPSLHQPLAMHNLEVIIGLFLTRSQWFTQPSQAPLQATWPVLPTELTTDAVSERKSRWGCRTKRALDIYLITT